MRRATKWSDDPVAYVSVGRTDTRFLRYRRQGVRDGVLVERNAAHGLRIGAHTGTPTWLGERLDLVHAIGVLHPLARQRSRVVAW